MKARLTWIILVALLTVFPAARGSAASSEDDVDALIGSLADADPAARERAGERLIQVGVRAREDVLAAARSDDPEIASRAGQVLLRLPWARPGDSPQAARILHTYGRPDERRRMIDAENLAKLREFEVLLRLLFEDPSDSVRWSIVRRLKGSADETIIARMREVDPQTDNIPALTLAGRVWFSRDREKGVALLRRAVDLERSRPAVDWGELDFAFEFLTRAAVASRSFDEAADLLRRQAARQHDGQTTPPAAIQLLALHGYAGQPIRGYAHDLAVYGPLVGRPNVLDDALLFQRGLGAAPAPLAALAYASTMLSYEQRFEGADFLFTHGLTDAAADELRRTLAMPAQSEMAPGVNLPGGLRDRIDANALFRLAHIAAEAGDDQAAADHLTAAMHRKDAAGFSLDGAAEEDVWSEIHARSLKAATKKGDAAAAREHAAKLAPLTPSNSDLALSAIDALGAHGAAKEADALFERAYTRLKAQIDAEPANPQLLNNLAWLCARAGKRLDESLDFATRALAADPDNPALLDTAAEANFRLGRIDEAIRLESRALELRPDEKFMAEQLERFKAARTK